MRTARAAEEMRRYWDERARENAMYYVDTSCAYDEPDLDRFLEAGRRIVATALVDAPVRPERRRCAVELGSGLGRNCLALADHFDEVVGIDVSSEMIRRASEMAAHPRVRFELGNGTDLRPLTSDSADLVLSFTVFQHMPEPALVASNVADIARVLRPGGVAALQWNNLPRAGVWRLRSLATRTARRLGVGRFRDPRYAAPFLGRPIPWSRLRDELRRHGLEPAATDGLGTLFAWVWATKR